MAKLMHEPTRKMELAAEFGIMVVLKRDSSRMDSHMDSAERFLKTDRYSKACGEKVGDMDKGKK